VGEMSQVAYKWAPEDLFIKVTAQPEVIRLLAAGNLTSGTYTLR
jgi:hypothetical protein